MSEAKDKTLVGSPTRLQLYLLLKLGGVPVCFKIASDGAAAVPKMVGPAAALLFPLWHELAAHTPKTRLAESGSTTGLECLVDGLVRGLA